MSTINPRLIFDRTPIGVALISLAVLLAGVFIGAALTKEWGLFSLYPPGSDVADIRHSQLFDLYAAFYSAWATILLLIPAFCAFWFRNQSQRGAGVWRAFWTAAFIAYKVHFYLAFWVLFDGDMQRVMNTPRVSAAVLDMVVSVWWGIDVVLAWVLAAEDKWIRIQRGTVHVLVFALFFLGSVKEGELLLSKSFGILMAIATATAWWMRRRAA